jgi:small neutral amino acid transporter SnatA (MarC family)
MVCMGFAGPGIRQVLSTPNELAPKNTGCVLIKRVISYTACKIQITAMLHGNVSSEIFEIFMLLVLRLSYAFYHLLHNKGLNVTRQHLKLSPTL